MRSAWSLFHVGCSAIASCKSEYVGVQLGSRRVPRAVFGLPFAGAAAGGGAGGSGSPVAPPDPGVGGFCPDCSIDGSGSSGGFPVDPPFSPFSGPGGALARLGFVFDSGFLISGFRTSAGFAWCLSGAWYVLCPVLCPPPASNNPGCAPGFGISEGFSARCGCWCLANFKQCKYGVPSTS